MGLSKADRKKLELEVISSDARLKLTRLVRGRCRTGDGNANLIRQNQFINMARTVLGKTIYRLEPDDLGMFMDEEFAWHSGEIELVMRRPNTIELVELLADLLQDSMLDMHDVNDVLKQDNSSVRFDKEGFDEDVIVQIMGLDEIEVEDNEADHPNIRVLIDRMDSALARKDYAAVLHASANVFETLAKLVFNDPRVENQTLGGLIAGYRARSALPEPVLDYIIETYNRRSKEPLAGHGATLPSTVTQIEASVLVEMTKMCVRLERRLSLSETGRGSAMRPSSGDGG